MDGSSRAHKLRVIEFDPSVFTSRAHESIRSAARLGEGTGGGGGDINE